MRASLRIRLHRGRDGSVVASGNLATPPLWCRWDGSILWLVGSAASPVGDDRVELQLEVADDVTAAVRSVAAMIVYAAEGAGTTMTTTIRVGPDARLRWQPEPVIVTARARHRATTRVEVASGGRVCVDEVVVLGRSGERCGRLHSTCELVVAGTTTALTSFDTATPGWDGPGGVGGAHVMATRVLGDPTETAEPATCVPIADRSRPPIRGEVLRPEGGGQLAVVVAGGVEAARADLDTLLPAAVPQDARPSLEVG